MSQSPAAWTVEIVLPHAALGLFEDRLGELGLALSTFEKGAARDPLLPAVEWVMQVLFDTAPDIAALRHAVAEAAEAAGIPAPPLGLSELPATDWVSHTNTLLRPLRAGRFFLYGQHDADKRPPGRHAIRMEAGQAFGTGRAPSTFGCLLAIERLARQKRLGRVLDLGCGSGVLALAAAKAGARAVLATDIDPIAVRVARRNARLNGVRMQTLAAKGLHHPGITRAAPYDLIVANILSGPLKRLAQGIATHLAPGGTVVLSGLLDYEERGVRAAYAAAGLAFTGRIAIEGWHTLLFRSGPLR